MRSGVVVVGGEEPALDERMPHAAPHLHPTNPVLPLSACSGRGGLYRQTILLSSFASAEMNALMARTCRNHAGRVRVLPAYRGVLSCIIHQARQLFERLPAAVAAGPDGGSIAGVHTFSHCEVQNLFSSSQP